MTAEGLNGPSKLTMGGVLLDFDCCEFLHLSKTKFINYEAIVRHPTAPDKRTKIKRATGLGGNDEESGRP
jgi:hypothetical protein